MIRHPYSVLFERLWQASPRRGSKRNAETAFLKLRVEEEDMDMLLDAMQWQVKEYKEEHPDTMKYFPHTSSWLNGECWDKEQPKKIDDCICGKANDGTHKYSMVQGRKVYKCNVCRGAGGNIRIG